MTVASLVFYLAILILPVAALASRRLPARQVLAMAFAWMAIFGVGFLLLCYFT